MMRGILTILSMVSVFLFPWQVTVLLALATSPLEPFVPFAAGILADTLYYAPSTGAWPFFSLYGALAALLALFVRSRLDTSIIGR